MGPTAPDPRNSKRRWSVPLLGLLLLGLGAHCRRPVDRPPAAAEDTANADRAAHDPGASQDTPPWFQDVTREVGLDFVHGPGTPGGFFFPEIMAGGAALLDFDSDGDLDIYLVNGSEDRPGRAANQADSSTPVNRLYRQEPDGSFVDVTRGSGLDDPGYGMGVAVGDLNNDGLPDVYVSNYGPDRLFLNRGGGRFEDITREAGIDNPHWGSSAAFVDFDRDGRLDLFVCNYVDYDPSRPCRNPRGVADYCHPSIFPPTSDRLFQNVSELKQGLTAADYRSDSEGQGEAKPAAAGPVPPPETNEEGAAPAEKIRFRDVSLSAGIVQRRGAGLGVTCLDVDRDGWPDIYVANDGEANRLWMNQRDGTFRDEAILRGVAYDLLGVGQASMGVAVGDLNKDQRFDLLLTHFGNENNALYVSDEQRGFREESDAWRLAGPSLPFTGFGTALADFDQDGDLDLAVVNGRVVLADDQESPAGDSNNFFAVYAERNQLFRNTDQRFAALESAAEEFGQAVETSRALVLGDVDNDGALDLLVTNIGGPARLLRNINTAQAWLGVRAVDPRLGHRDAYGAVITLRAAQRQWIRQVQPASSYLSSNDPRVHFGLGDVREVEELEVLWPDGRRETFAVGELNRYHVLERGTGSVER